MNQAKQNAIRTLAAEAIATHKKATTTLGRKPTPQEVKEMWQPLRDQAMIISDGECKLVDFNIVIRNVARGL